MSTQTNREQAEQAIEAFDEPTKDAIAAALWQRSLDLSTISDALLATLASEKNSPAAYGARMRAFLHYLTEHPVEHAPSFEKNYQHLLPFCDQLSPQAAYAMALNFLGPAATVGYDMVPTVPDFKFPRDFGPKNRSQISWHFFVGSCWDVDGNEYGVELMFFQSGLFPPFLAAGMGLTEDENQVVELQLAISQRGHRHWQADPVVVGGTSGLVESAENPFEYHVGRNSMVCHRRDEFFPITIKGWGLDRGEDPPRELGVDITFTSGKQYLFQGANGAMPAVDGIGTWYYSIPNIELDPSCSTLNLDGRTIELVRGTFWFDRQWGYLNGVPRSKVLRAANFSGDPKPSGWDWFMAQLEGDRQVTVFAPHEKEFSQFYEQTGPNPPPTMTVQVGGSYMDPDKVTTMTWGTLEVTDWIKAEQSPNPKRYLATDTWYPNRWTFRFDDVVPQDIRSITMTPIVDMAQSGFFGNGAQYAEGAVVVTTPSGQEVGRGFAESVSYANTRRTAHRLAGLPESQAHIDSLAQTKMPKALALFNTGYVLAHQDDLAQVIKESAGLEFFSKPADRPAPPDPT
ncbi:MAG: lipocalin-like domain-containing protein [Actinomycetes bacterium]